MKQLFLLLVLVLIGLELYSQITEALRINDIRIRDPYILADSSTGTYYMYAQMTNKLNYSGSKNGVEVYTSKDLEKWEGPFAVFTIKNDFWGKKKVWAPEVHQYKGNYYLFVTFTAENSFIDAETNELLPRRAVQILYSKSPKGPFKPFVNKPHTPDGQMTLDGTLWVEDNVPFMIYCHEWIQTKDGEINLVELKSDLSATKGKSTTLFTAGQAPWSKKIHWKKEDIRGWVTDGPFICETQNGKLNMIWSSFGDNGYAIGLAYSKTNSIHGPWVQYQKPLFAENGGHGMIFRNFSGQLMLVFHQPNDGPYERAKFYLLEDIGDRVVLKK